MATAAQAASQIRFALSQLPAHNAHHVFEDICRHLTTQFICSNVLPATGPVSAGGDQGRDFETFRSYLRNELGPHGGFLGLVSDGTIAFVCTTQAEDLAAKVAHDIEKICASGHPVHEVKAFSLASLPVLLPDTSWNPKHSRITKFALSYSTRRPSLIFSPDPRDSG